MDNNKKLLFGALLPRREFLKASALLSIPLALGGGMSLPAFAAAYTPPKRKRGSKVVNVKNYGAVGNGRTDDTDAFNRAINALPSTGGTVYVPAGRYLITTDYRRKPGERPLKGNSIRLRSRMHLKLNDDAILLTKPTAAQSGFVIFAELVSDVEISGGRIIGDRDKHLTDTGEWGHGIQIRGCKRVTIRDMHISKCWGDGVCVGGKNQTGGRPQIRSEDVAIYNIVSTRSRRQALSLGPCTNVEVRNSEFSYTEGTSPECGIDIEPEKYNYTDNVNIQDCVIHNNRMYGILLFNRISNSSIKRCEVAYNSSGIVIGGCSDIYVALNKIHNQRLGGLRLRIESSNIIAVQNTFYENYRQDRRNPSFKLIGWSEKVKKDLSVEDGFTNIRRNNQDIRTNIYK